MKYLITETMRKGSDYFEFQKGIHKGEFWKEDSLLLSAERFDELELKKLFSKACSHFSYYGETRIEKDDWERLKQEASKQGGEVGLLIEELNEWVNTCLKEEGCFTLLGI